VIQIVGLYYPAPMYGTAVVARKIAEKAYKNGFLSFVLTTDLFSYCPYKRLKLTPEKFNGVTIERANTLPFPKMYPYFPIDIFLKLSKILNGSYGIIHAHTYLDLSSFFVGFYKAIKKPCQFVLQPHFHPFPGGTLWGRLIRNIHDGTIGKSLVKMADSVIVMSDVEKHAMQKLGASVEDIIKLPHGIESLNVEKKRDKELKNKWKLNKNHRLIICVSRIDTAVVPFFINLLNLLDKKFVVVLIGGLTGNLTYKIKNVIPKYLKKRFILTGFLPREALDAVYLMGDVFVKPTHYEAFGIAYLEAMSAGLPILSYRVGALPELIKDDENGFLFEVGEIGKIAEKIKELCENKKLYQKISENNKNKAKKYLWNDVLDRYMKLYEELARQIS